MDLLKGLSNIAFSLINRGEIILNFKISIVIPIYNVQEYLEDCIESVINQTYNNIEIILVDDGSTDHCPQMCDEYATKDNRIQVIHKKNGGLSDARNAGIKAATGEYITFIDSDDFVDEHFVEYLFKLIMSQNSDISVCHSVNVDESGKQFGSQQKFANVLYKSNQECMEGFLIADNVGTVAWGKLYKTSLFNNVEYALGKYHEDVFTTYKLVAQCNRIVCGKETLYCYRHRIASISTQSFSEKHLDAIQGKIEQRDFLKKNYPNLTSIGNAEILYAVNVCVLRLIEAKRYEKKYIQRFQKYYRQYEKDFLRGRSSKAAKIFSLASFCNLSLTMHLYAFLRGEK